MMLHSTGRGYRLTPNAWYCAGAIWLLAILFFLYNYRNYSVIRAVILVYEQEKRTVKSCVLIADSSDTSEQDDDFILVNRNPADLLREALSFAREHNLAESVEPLYKKQEWHLQENKSVRSKKTVPKNKKRRIRKRKSTLIDAEKKHWQQPKSVDPRFDLPIDKDSFWLSSPFGTRRIPGGGKRFHFGIDMAAVHGTVVKASGDGEVVQAGYQAGYGNVVVIRHDEKFKTRYAHLSKIATSVGKRVQKGQKIGNVGSTGNARASGKTRDASHLHFEIEVYNKRVNPFYFLNNA